jgi:hypothetical protein
MFGNQHRTLIGSSRSNPWTGLFESQMNFQFEYDEQKREARVRNKKPRSGEPEVFATKTPSGMQDSYSIAAFLPNLASAGHVLIPAGTSIQGTGAAGEFVTVEPRFSGFLHRAGLDPASPLPRSEVLLMAGVLGGTVSRSEIVSFRVSTWGGNHTGPRTSASVVR